MDRYQDEMAPATALLFLDKAPEDIPTIALELCSRRDLPPGPALLCNQRELQQQYFARFPLRPGCVLTSRMAGNVVEE